MMKTTMTPYEESIKMIILSTRPLTEIEKEEVSQWALHLRRGAQLPSNKDIINLGDYLSTIVKSVRFTYS